MIQVNSLHYNHPASGRFTRSHTLTPHDAVTIFCIVDWLNESAVSIIEDHILENISSTEWNIKELSQDFSYLTEHYNNFIKSFDEEEITNIKVLIAMLEWDNLTLATIGWTYGTLIEKNWSITDISVHENKYHEFHSISSGKIANGATVYLASGNLEQILWVEILEELSQLEPSVWIETTTNLLEREISSNLHIMRLSRKSHEIIHPAFSREKRKQSDIIRDKWALFVEYVRSKKMWEKTKKYIKKLPTLENKKYQYAFLWIGVALLFVLLYSLTSTLLGVLENSKSDSKNLLIQAKILIEESQKLSTNPSAFNLKITAAEKILFDLRKEQIYTVDIQELLGQIASMKKEVYDIQTIDMSRYITLIPFDPATIVPIWVFEKDKKLNLVGEESAIIDYVSGDKTLKQIKFPWNEKIQSFDFGEDGSVFLLTKQNHIIVPRRDQFAYVNVTGQNSWEESLGIKTFNGNIYLLNAQKNQVERHKPWINGFSQKSSIFTKIQPWILDISIDGGIYLYMEDGKILRYTGNPEKLDNITLNKIPGEWNINPTLWTTFITKGNLSYTYIHNGNRIWIFQPNSKRFQDITSWEYRWQFELKTEETIKSIQVPRDGSIYVTTDRWVYELKFEFIDGKIIFK
jgi:hypothetical protein